MSACLLEGLEKVFSSTKKRGEETFFSSKIDVVRVWLTEDEEGKGLVHSFFFFLGKESPEVQIVLVGKSGATFFPPSQGEVILWYSRLPTYVKVKTFNNLQRFSIITY